MPSMPSGLVIFKLRLAPVRWQNPRMREALDLFQTGTIVILGGVWCCLFATLTRMMTQLRVTSEQCRAELAEPSRSAPDEAANQAECESGEKRPAAASHEPHRADRSDEEQPAGQTRSEPDATASGTQRRID